jgi:hypothetical protein
VSWSPKGDKPDRRSQGDHRKKGKLLRATDFSFWSANAVADVIVSRESLNISFFFCMPGKTSGFISEYWG